MWKAEEPLSEIVTCDIKQLLRENFKFCPKAIEVDRHPKVRDEVVSVFISAMMGNIVTSWEGHSCIARKLNPSDKAEEKEVEEEEEEEIEINDKSDSNELEGISSSGQLFEENEEEESNHEEREGITLPPATTEVISSISDPNLFISEWKFKEGDHDADILFKNGNTYKGRMSRNVMHGEGEFHWANGTSYKGTFVNGSLGGKGKFVWPCGSWYNGEVYHGYRHGYGIYVVPNEMAYIGHWYKGKVHGKGFLVYIHNNMKSSMDVDWVYGTCTGNGCRIYPSGAQYEGEWKDGLQDGSGTMIWNNNDVYIGHWVSGKMEGFGKYIWNATMSNDFSKPARNSYFGSWINGMRSGIGILETISGITVKGEWKHNQKHGYAEVICRNGISFEGFSMFIKDNLQEFSFTNTHPWTFMAQLDDCNLLKFNYINVEDYEIKKSQQKGMSAEEKISVSAKHYTACSILDSENSHRDNLYISKTINFVPVLLPSEHIDLTYYTTRLVKCTHILEYISNFNAHRRTCNIFKEFNNENFRVFLKRKNDYFVKYKNFIPNDPMPFYRFEVECVRTIIVSHLPYLRRLYHDYAGMLCRESPNVPILMPRLLLWQLFRDCLYDTDINLTELDAYVKIVPASLIENKNSPFETLHFFQFLHYLLELSWQLYGKDCNGLADTAGVIASALERLIEENIKPNARNHRGCVLLLYRDLLSLHDLYNKVYCCYSSFTIRTYLFMILEIKPKQYLDYTYGGWQEPVKRIPSESIFDTKPYKNVFGLGDQPTYKCVPIKSWVEKMIDATIIPVKVEDINFDKLRENLKPSNESKQDLKDVLVNIPQEYSTIFLRYNLQLSLANSRSLLEMLEEDSLDTTPSLELSETKITENITNANQEDESNSSTSISNEIETNDEDQTDDIMSKYSLKNIDFKIAMKCIKEVCPQTLSNNSFVNMDYKITFLEFYELLVISALKSIDIDKKARLAEIERRKGEEGEEEEEEQITNNKKRNSNNQSKS